MINYNNNKDNINVNMMYMLNLLVKLHQYQLVLISSMEKCPAYWIPCEFTKNTSSNTFAYEYATSNTSSTTIITLDTWN